MYGMDDARGSIATMNDGVSGAGVVRGLHAIRYSLSVGFAALDYVRHLFSFLCCSFSFTSSLARQEARLRLLHGEGSH